MEPAADPDATRLIRPGDSGSQVADVQSRLGRVLDPALEIDGEYGLVTRQAVRRFQRDRGLPADGIVGPETWRALVEAGYQLGDRLLWHSSVMMRGDDVRELQHRLNQLGFDPGAEDGIYGPLAQAAVEEFQRNIGLAVDGVAGPRTLQALHRLRRAHHSAGLGVGAREREVLRRLAGHGLTGARILVDPARGPDDPGHTGPTGFLEHELTWVLATTLVAKLHALGADAMLSRGPATTPSGSGRARLANELDADVVFSVGLNAHTNPAASGCSSYSFGGKHFVSEAGRSLAEFMQTVMTAAGWTPDCRYHTMTWAILRETRMPAVVVEPGFITSPVDERRLADRRHREALTDIWAGALARFLGEPALATPAWTEVTAAVG